MEKLKPLVIKLSGDEKYQRLLSGRPETAGFRSGLVNLKPKEEIGQHSTEEKEEVLIILNGIVIQEKRSKPIFTHWTAHASKPASKYCKTSQSPQASV